ncbi:uncharacterized protein BXZ73DRAFT_19511, partial [Epithele typhae]|uniref:uncharacterized protein n=1 Tax=Epithele typhae TaxID=378194 RepID=UPI002008E6C4
RGIACGETTSYDAEMMAQEMGLGFATKQLCEAIHVVADNESMLRTILDTGMHTQRPVSVIACRKVRECMEKEERRRIVSHWCPSHVGIEWNERVVEDAKAAADLPTVVNERPLAKCLLVEVRLERKKQCRENRAYAGKHFLGLRVFDSPKYTTSAALEAHGHSTTRMARFCRAVLNHAPIVGSLGKRFLPNEPTECPTCHVLQSRAHIL